MSCVLLGDGHHLTPNPPASRLLVYCNNKVIGKAIIVFPLLRIRQDPICLSDALEPLGAGRVLVRVILQRCFVVRFLDLACCRCARDTETLVQLAVLEWLLRFWTGFFTTVSGSGTSPRAAVESRVFE